MIIESLEVGLFAENCYIVGCSETHEGVVIDPGDEIPRVLQRIEALRLNIRMILLTHGHLDHVKEVAALKKEIDVPVLMHKDDQFLLDNLPAQAAAFGLTTSGIPQIDRYIEGGERVEFGNVKLDVLYTPGHSPGSVTFAGENLAFSGDVLFSGSIGRTDLPGGDFATLIGSIRDKLFSLADDSTIYPGHGPATTIGHERLHNPFLVQDNRQ